MEETFDSTEVLAVQLDERLRSTKDHEIFEQAGRIGAVVMTKDRDFVDLLEQRGPPPQVLWVTCGNTSNREMRRILSIALPDALTLLHQGESLVEISDRD